VCSAALHLASRAFRVGPGDEVAGFNHRRRKLASALGVAGLAAGRRGTAADHA
jgi:hypothetical protein